MSSHSLVDDVELDEFLFSSSPRGSFYSLRTVDDDDQREQEPLIFSPSTSIVSSPRGGSPRPQHPRYESTEAGRIGQSSRSATYFSSKNSPEYSYFESIMEKVKNTRIAKFVDRFAVESEPGLTNTQLMLTNFDLKPVEPERRQWGAWNFVGFWIADSFNINTWMISSSMITLYGLSWWQSWLCVWIGYSISACFVCATGRIGSTYHIGFSIAARSSFGLWGSLWPVFNRAAMACIWYGVQAWIGGTCVKIMISSIWKSFETPPDTTNYPAANDLVAFIIFWLCSLPAIWFPVHKIRHLFTVKAYFVPVAALAYFSWAVSKAGGIGPIVHQGNTAKGSELGWGIVKGIMSSIANFATLIVNNPDFARFARKPKDAFWPQLITIPVGFAVTSIIGIIVSSSSAVIYGEAVWNPLDLLHKFLKDAGPGQRFGVFVIAFAFALAQLGTNIAANSISAGTDMTALLPRYLNIRRGGYICAVIGIVMCPWHLLESSNKFTTYLSAYSVFMSSIAGVIVCDYYWVRKGYLQVKDLYSSHKTGPYFYNYGINWRGYVAYIFGVFINIVGFAGAIGTRVPIVATYIYNFNYFAGFIVACVVYYLLCYFFPIPACSDHWMEVSDDIRSLSVPYDPEDASDIEGHAGPVFIKSAEAYDAPDAYQRRANF